MRILFVSLLALLMLTVQTYAAAITFFDTRIFIEGQIEQGDYNRFEMALTANGDKIKEVWINSPGGAYLEALNIGQDIHILGLTTVFYGDCFSACAWIVLAGKEIYYYRQENLAPILFWIHMPGIVNGPTQLPEWLMKKTYWYLEKVLTKLSTEAKEEILNTPNSNILYLSPAKMVEWGIPITLFDIEELVSVDTEVNTK